MTTSLSEQRCFNHRGREAAARCPECRRYFCRECVTEHEGRVICAGCLQAIHAGLRESRTATWLVAPVIQGVLAVLIAFATFYVVGRTLLALPDEFHEGTVWRDESGDE